MRHLLSTNINHDITVSRVDHARLTGLANAALDRMPDVADELLSEMERAKVTAVDKMPANVVRMGSRVSYRASDGDVHTIELVYPGEADIAEGRISILTPLGSALIGLREGQSVLWTARDGRSLQVEIIEVTQPSLA